MNLETDLIFKENPILKTKRLVLRPLIESDFDFYHNVFSDDKVTKYLNTEFFQTKEMMKTVFDNFLRYAKNQYYFAWIVSLNDTAEEIGIVNINAVRKQSARCDMGYAFLSDYWKRGYATESITKLINFLFQK